MSMKSTVRADPSEGGRTRQSEKDACDVNLIVAHHRRGGVSAHVMQRVAEYGYVPSSDFRENMEQLRVAQELFEALPAKTRDYFRNDPARFVEYCSDEKRRADLVELGLVLEPEKPVRFWLRGESDRDSADRESGAG